ncbi:MAG TPA: Ig-like domain-containing protein, partial [archaeon]|nr:Ig-like domain-containing protein [archaeon]
ASANRTVLVSVGGDSDTTAPSSLTYEAPTPASGSNQSSTSYTVNLTFTETNPNNCLLEVNGANVSMTRTGTYCEINRTSQSDNTYTYKVWVNDTAGNIAASATRTVTLDTVNPSVLANNTAYPGTQTAATNGQTVTLNATVSDTNLDKITVNAGDLGCSTALAMSLSNSVYTATCQLASATSGTKSLTVTANDTAGNVNNTITLSVVVDATAPTVTISSPTNTTYAQDTINLQVSADESIDKWWYNLNSGSNTTFTPNTTITPVSGSNTIIVYANDSTNNIGSTTIAFSANICGSTITSDITLTGNLTSQGTCFTVGANNLIINGAGYTVTGNTNGTGIATGGYDNLTIKNFAGLNNFTNGIQGASLTNSTIINNTIITGTTANSIGINLNSPITVNITSNTIIPKATAASGMSLIAPFNLSVYNNLITNNTANSILGIVFPSAGAGARNNTIFNNTIIITGFGGERGIQFTNPNSGNNISYNTISVAGGGGTDGVITMVGGTSNFIFKNTLTGTANGVPGIIMKTTTNNNNYILSNTIKTQGAEGYAIYNTLGDNNTAVNNILNATNDNDIRMLSGSLFSINNTFNKTDIGFDSGSTGNVTVQWYLDATVQNTTGTVIQNANVTIYNVTNSQLFNGLTDSNGKIPTQTLTEFVQNSTHKTLQTPHTINATLSNYEPDSTTVNLTMTNSTSITINLTKDTTAPTVSITSPASGANLSVTSISILGTASDTNADTITINDTRFGSNLGSYSSWNFTNSTIAEGTYTITITANDTAGNTQTATRTFTVDRTAPSSFTYQPPTPSTGANLSQSYYFVNLSFTETNPNNCLLEVNGANVSMTRTGTYCEINRTSQSDNTYTYKVHVNDSAGNRGASSTRSITLDTTVPSVTLPQVNITGSVPVATQIKINVTITDSSGISAVLVGNTTNVTMSSIGLNRYQVSTTPSSLGCSSDQATCLLRFYANDTAGNLNSTTILTLNIFGCGQTLTSSSTLASSLTGQGSCFTIGANNLVINGAGKTITGSGSGTAINTSSFTNITVANLTISNFATDASATSGSITLINTTFSRAKTTVSGSGNITAKWYVDNVVREWGFEYFEGSSGSSGYCGDSRCGSGEDQYSCYQDCSGSSSETCGNSFCGSGETSSNCAADCGGSVQTAQGISGANVTIYDSTGSRIYSILTGPTGQISRLELTEFVQRLSGKTLYTTHSINISKEGYAKFSRILNLTATGTTSLTHVLNKPFANCELYSGNQTQCVAAKCDWKSDISKCTSASTYLDCDQFCGKCTTQLSCTGSTGACIWESSGSSFCRENFSTFTYGTGGTTNASGYFNFVPVDCSSEPNKCDSSFDVDKGYYKFETLCSDSVDNDVDGSADCSDTDCNVWPQCASSYNASTDTTVPKIANSKTDLDNNSTGITTITTEPTTFSVKYYGTNSACASTATVVGERDLANCTLDDYSVWHHVTLDSTKGISLAANTTYYYKINGTDKAGLGYETGCLNFTTKPTVQTFNFRAFVPGELVKLKSSDSSSFTNYNFTSSASEFSSYKGAEMKFEGHGITFRSVDISGSKSLNFTNAFVSGNRSSFGGKFQGLNSSNWLETSQSLGLAPSDNISLTIESAGNRIFKCDDNGGNCTQLTECYSVISSNSTHTTIELAAAAGFSAYTVADNAQLLTWDQTDSNNSLYGASGATKTTADTVTFYANYSNLTSGVPINITGSYCEFNTTGVSPVNMTYSASTLLYSYSTSVSTAATHSWTARCVGNDIFDNLNATDNVTIGSPPSSGSTGSTGGSSYNGPTPTVSVAPTTSLEPELPIDFSVDKDLIKVQLKQNQTKPLAFIITNKGAKAEAVITVEGVSDMIFLDPSRVVLGTNEGYEIKGSVVTLDSTKPGVYTSKIKVAVAGVEKIVNVIIEVSTKKALFDVRLDIPPDQRITFIGSGGGTVEPLITLINIGDLEKVDVVLRYVVKDSENNVVSETMETKGVEKQLSFSRNLELPPGSSEDNYIAYVEATYGDAVAVASQLFKVVKGERPVRLENMIYIGMVIIIIVVVAAFLVKTHTSGRRFARKRRGI